jgi:hypothetical protein
MPLKLDGVAKSPPCGVTAFFQELDIPDVCLEIFVSPSYEFLRKHQSINRMIIKNPSGKNQGKSWKTLAAH